VDGGCGSRGRRRAERFFLVGAERFLLAAMLVPCHEPSKEIDAGGSRQGSAPLAVISRQLARETGTISCAARGLSVC
jgi:hypothetical protein